MSQVFTSSRHVNSPIRFPPSISKWSLPCTRMKTTLLEDRTRNISLLSYRQHITASCHSATSHRYDHPQDTVTTEPQQQLGMDSQKYGLGIQATWWQRLPASLMLACLMLSGGLTPLPAQALLNSPNAQIARSVTKPFLKIYVVQAFQCFSDRIGWLGWLKMI